MRYFWAFDVTFSNSQPSLGTRSSNVGRKFSEIKVQKNRLLIFVMDWNLARSLKRASFQDPRIQLRGSFLYFTFSSYFCFYFLAAHTSKCEKSRLDALANGPLLGQFVSHCKDDGSYEPAQCWASTGYCWCVDENGEKKDGSTVRFKHPGCL